MEERCSGEQASGNLHGSCRMALLDTAAVQRRRMLLGGSLFQKACAHAGHHSSHAGYLENPTQDNTLCNQSRQRAKKDDLEE